MDHFGDRPEAKLREPNHGRAHPGSRRREDREHRDHLRHERERLLLNLRRRRKDRDRDADEQREQDRRHRHHDGDEDGFVRDLNDEVLNFHYSYPSTSPRVIRYQPSTRTNSNILNGSEMVVGDSICIPSAIRMFDTTISITRNGMKMMNPI